MIKNNEEIRDLEILEVEDMDNATVQDIEEGINENFDNLNENNNYENIETSKSEEVTLPENDIVQDADVDCEDDTKDENRESQNLEKLELDSVERINSEISDLEAYEPEEVTLLENSNVNASLKKFVMSDIQKPDTKAHEARKVEKADFSVVNTSGNGKRMKFSKELLKKLGLKSIDNGSIDIGFTLHETVVSTDLSGIGETFHLSKGGHIYSKDLVEEISKRFKLDFNGITTRSFSEPEYQALDTGCIVAIIKM